MSNELGGWAKKVEAGEQGYRYSGVGGDKN